MRIIKSDNRHDLDQSFQCMVVGHYDWNPGRVAVCFQYPDRYEYGYFPVMSLTDFFSTFVW